MMYSFSSFVAIKCESAGLQCTIFLRHLYSHGCTCTTCYEHVIYDYTHYHMVFFSLHDIKMKSFKELSLNISVSKTVPYDNAYSCNSYGSKCD